MKFDKISIFFVSFILFISFSFSQTRIKEVEVTVYSASYSNGINQGLVDAIGMVNGRSIESESLMKSSELSVSTNKDNSYYSTEEYQNQIKEIIHNNKKTEKWNENMSGVNEKQYEKIQKLKGDVLRYKEAKDQLQSQVNKMTKDKQLFKDRINDLKEEKKKNEEIIENFKAI